MTQYSAIFRRQGDSAVASLYISSGLWSILWDRLAQLLHVCSPETDLPIHDIEDGGTGEVIGNIRVPDWSLMSYNGLMAALTVADTVFVKVSQIAYIRICIIPRFQMTKF